MTKRKLVFAIGDVHGCVRELAQLLKKIEDYDSGGARKLIIGLGDYFDRGPEGPAAYRLLGAPNPAYDTIRLPGNHDLAFARAIVRVFEQAVSSGESVCDVVGRVLFGTIPKTTSASHLEARAALRASIALGGMPNLLWYEQTGTTIGGALEDAISVLQLRTFAQVGRWLFSHAGFDPDKDLHEQTESDMTAPSGPVRKGIRFGRRICAGHYVTHKPLVIEESFGAVAYADTGCVFGGHLTALVIDPEAGVRDALQVRSSTRRPVVAGQIHRVSCDDDTAETEDLDSAIESAEVRITL